MKVAMKANKEIVLFNLGYLAHSSYKRRADLANMKLAVMKTG
jgi:hypothetical protein